MDIDALLQRISDLVEEIGHLRESIATLVRENVQFRDALRTISGHLLALVEPMRQSARATEDIAGRENTVLWKFANELEAIGRSLAVLVDNVKDSEKATRDLTGKIPLQVIDDNDTDKRLGKNVRKYGTALLEVITHRVVPWIVAGALGAWHVIEKLAHLAK